MDKSIKRWIGMMNFFSRYWGCHQLPERSFFWHGWQFPVCARCTGIIFGEIVYLIFFKLCSKFSYVISVILQLPMIIDGGMQLITNYRSNNKRRFVTGFIAGLNFLNILYGTIKSIYNIFSKKQLANAQ